MRPALMLTTLLLAVAACAAPPEYPVYRAACAVVLDGEIASDPAWAAVPEMTGFSVLGGGYSHTKQTVAQMCYDDEALYLAVTCEEPDVAALKPVVRDGGDTWAEDSLEVFLQPLPNAQVYQIGITAGGARGGFIGDPDPLGFEAAARIGERQYTIEARFPAALVKGKLEGVWRGNICRNVFADLSGGDKFTSWAPLETQFNEPRNFASFAFQPTALTQAEAARITEQLNVPYRGTLAELISQAAAMGARYTDALKEASSDPVFGDRARRLTRQWRTIARMNRTAQTASVAEMRNALAQLKALNDESYEVKYTYLIRKLLSEE